MTPVVLKPWELDFEMTTERTLIGGLPGAAEISTSFCVYGEACATSLMSADGTKIAAPNRPTSSSVAAVMYRRNRPGLSSVAVLVSSLVGAAMPTWVVSVVRDPCHQRRAGASGSASEGMPSPRGPTAPKTGNPLSDAIFWTAGSSQTTVPRWPIRAA